MSGRRFASGLLCAPLVLATLAARSAGINPDEMAGCAAIAAADARLACYDGLAAKYTGHSPTGATLGNVAGPVPTDTSRAQATAGSPATSSTAASAATPATSAGASAPASGAHGSAPPDNFAENDPKNFGLSRAQLHEVQPGPSAIQARIVKTYQDQVGRTVIVLDLGQTWTCSDDDGRISAGDQVTIKHGALASFSMLTAAHHLYKVHRVQ